MHFVYKYACCFLSIIFFVASPLCAQDLAARIILFGDGGRLTDNRHPVAEALSHYIDKADDKTTVLFLGDNIYSYGLPDKDDNTYPEKEAVLQKQLEPFYGYKAMLYLIPGNHDWAKGGPGGLRRVQNQSKWVQDLHKENIRFLPENACPGPEEVHLSEDIVLVIMDTQWWLHRHEKTDQTSPCDCKTEDEVIIALKDIAYRNKDKQIVFVAHHPFRSYGTHGGYFPFKMHLFPLTELHPNAYVPLPVLGSLYPFLRGSFGNIQDLRHPVYKDIIKRVEDAFKDVKDISFVAGHEHNFQLIQDKNREYIISGSAVNLSSVKKKSNALFTAEKNGFAEILFFQNGTKKISFYAVEQDTLNLLFARDIKAEKTLPTSALKNVQKQQFPDSMIVAIAPAYDRVSLFHRFFFGEHYRKLWASPVKMKVFKMDEEKGGLTIIKKGGGQQTKSLRLKDSTGKQWVLRTVQKDPEKALPANLRETVAKDIVQDQIAAANPYAPLCVPVLASALAVPHANPLMVYVPDDEALGLYRADFANTVCLLEEREPISDKTYNTFEVLDKLQKDNDNIVDQKAVLKARMLDLLIGDWDRHEDQWRWAKRKEAKKNIYYPIPRDRDQAFFISTGVFPYIASRNWLQPKFQGFDYRLKNVKGFMFNARYFDRYFLNALDKQDWMEMIDQIQHELSNAYIDKAIRQLPDTIYQQVGESIAAKLKCRRDALMNLALSYYHFLSKQIDIPLSDKKEQINVYYKSDRTTALQVKKINKHGDTSDVLYDRVFTQGETKGIRIYGRGDDDVFNLSGLAKPRMKLRLIGGGGHDVFRVQKGSGKKSKIQIYDRGDKPNDFPTAGSARVKTSSHQEINRYEAKAFKYDLLIPQATGGYNLDDGVFIGLGGQYTKHGFRKEPYQWKQHVMIGRAFATNASFINYKGDFIGLIGAWDLNVDFNFRAPNNTANFFGPGNETEFQKIAKPYIQYYRARYQFSDLNLLLKYRAASNFNVFAGFEGQFFNIEDSSENHGRFIESYAANNPSQELYVQKWYGGIKTGFELDTRDHKRVPQRGLHWLTTFTALDRLSRGNNAITQLKTELSFLLSFSRNPSLVFADRIGFGTTFGKPEFFQLLYLGGNTGLLGYRKNRFAGISDFYNNFELRLKLFDFASYLFPGALGLIAFDDVGRVWVENDQSAKWHMGYGGGLYVIPAQSFVLTGLLGFSEEGVLPYVALGFRF